MWNFKLVLKLELGVWMGRLETILDLIKVLSNGALIEFITNSLISLLSMFAMNLIILFGNCTSVNCFITINSSNNHIFANNTHNFLNPNYILYDSDPRKAKLCNMLYDTVLT